MLDVSLGNIRINQTGASGGGLSEAEKELNPNGYYIIGETVNYNVIVARGVKTELTFDSVKIESNNITPKLCGCFACRCDNHTEGYK